MNFILFLLLLSHCLFAATDTIQAAKAPDSVSRQASAKSNVKFDYKVVEYECGPLISENVLHATNA